MVVVDEKTASGTDSRITDTECSVLGVRVAVTDMDGAVGCVCDNLSSVKGGYLCFTNAHTTVTAHDDAEYMEAQNGSVATFPDGKSVMMTMRKNGYQNAERVAGPDFMQKIFDISEERGYSHYFFGSTNDTLEKLREKLLEKYPAIKIAGMFSPAFSDNVSKEEDDETVDRINAAGADFVWVGLGAPKQEKWMYEHKGRINALMAGVGAGFDYHAGKLKRAPKWMQKMCLEWLYRLLQEPRRLFSRYLHTNLRYISLNRKYRKKNKVKES